MTSEVERWSRLRAELYSLISRDARSNRAVVALATPRKGDVVLDIGCGSGAAVRRAAAQGADATGVDPSAAMVAIATRRSDPNTTARFVVGAADDLPVPDDSCTIAWTIASMHHWPQTRPGLIEMCRVLRPGGRLYVAEHARSRPGGHGLTRQEADTTADLLRSLGMVDAGVDTHGRWLAKLFVVTATKSRAAV